MKIRINDRIVDLSLVHTIEESTTMMTLRLVGGDSLIYNQKPVEKVDPKKVVHTIKLDSKGQVSRHSAVLPYELKENGGLYTTVVHGNDLQFVRKDTMEWLWERNQTEFKAFKEKVKALYVDNQSEIPVVEY